MIPFHIHRISRIKNQTPVALWGLISLLLLGSMGCTINIDLGKNPPLSVSPGEETTSAPPLSATSSAQPNTPVSRKETTPVASTRASETAVASTTEDTPRRLEGEGNVISPSTRYQDEAFSPMTYEEIPWWGEACTVYPVREVIGSNICTYSRDYEFANGVLLMSAYGTEGAIAVFRPNQPMTVDEAKKLGWILSKGEVTQNRISEQNDRRIVYTETSELTGSGPTLTLDLDEGKVVKILFEVSTP